MRTTVAVCGLSLVMAACGPDLEGPAVGSGGETMDPGAMAQMGGGDGGGLSVPAPGEVGAPCTADAECAGDKARCLTDWPGGYCVILDCAADTCPVGSECYRLEDDSTLCLKTCDDATMCRGEYACPSYGACTPGCTAGACEPGEVCDPMSRECKPEPCTPGSCGAGLVCTSGQCVPDLAGGPGMGPGPSCTLPPRDCTGSAAHCGELVPFEPVMGPGYDNYPLNGETAANQYRSYARRDLMMLVKWAAAYVDCKAKGWGGGNGMPIGLGDMSEANGAIPGTSDGNPGHPKGTHTGGFDMDIAYFQALPPDNHLRPICPHRASGAEAYHCVAPPDNFDLWRSSLFIGALVSHPNIRVLGVDGQVGPLVEQGIQVLCANDWMPAGVCSKWQRHLAYETTNMDRGWYYHHHHHLHVSLKAPAASFPDVRPGCLDAACAPGTGARLLGLAARRVPGEARILPSVPLQLR